MPRRSLLDIASGGQYKTSQDLPSLRQLLSEMAEYQRKEMSKEVGFGVTQGNLYDMVTGTAGLARSSSGVARGILGKAGVKVQKLRSIQKLKIQKDTIPMLLRHSMSKEGSKELNKIYREIDHYLGPQRSARILKQGGNQNAPSIRKLDRKKYKIFEERLDALSKKEGGVVRVEYEKGLGSSKPQTAKSLTSKQRIEREKLREEKRLFRELGGLQRGRKKRGIL